ncbi:MAG TPA: hypothetical protein VG940_07735 [Gemmatimonadales bacterium]|nr:hypothetical protein [Gemmatimonadales bacterium]
MRRALIVLAALLLVAGCGADEGEETFIRVNVDGVLRSGPAIDAQLTFSVDNPDDSGTYASVAVQTIGTTERIFSLGLPVSLVPGTYALDGHGTWAGYASCPVNGAVNDCAFWTVVPEDPGTLTITDFDGETRIARGTFTVNGHFLGDPEGEVKPLTSGAFAIRVPPTMTVASPR